jgi:hypothetical protein
MPCFRTMRQMPFLFKRIFGRAVLHFTKLNLAVRCNFELWSGFTSVNSATHRKTILSGRLLYLFRETPQRGRTSRKICSQAPAVFPELSLTSRGALENRWSPDLPQKYEPVLPVHSVHHELVYGCLPVLRSVETWLPKLNSAKPGGPQVFACREGSCPTLAYRTNVMFWKGQRQKPRMAYLSGLRLASGDRIASGSKMVASQPRVLHIAYAPDHGSPLED